MKSEGWLTDEHGRYRIMWRNPTYTDPTQRGFNWAALPDTHYRRSRAATLSYVRGAWPKCEYRVEVSPVVSV